MGSTKLGFQGMDPQVGFSGWVYRVQCSKWGYHGVAIMPLQASFYTTFLKNDGKVYDRSTAT